MACTDIILVRIAVQDLHEGLLFTNGFDRKMRIAVPRIFIGTVENLPIDQLSVSRKSNTPRTDPPLKGTICFWFFDRYISYATPPRSFALL